MEKDLENGKISFIGDAEKRIKEDYLEYYDISDFLNYSKMSMIEKLLKVIKKNLDGVSKISSERLLR